VINNTGGNFDCPLVEEFFLLYTALFSYSSKMKTAWKAHFGRVPKSHSQTRWYSKYEVLKEVYDLGWLPSIHNFLRSPAALELRENSTVKKMLAWY
jgi:hypothetical protein